MSTINEPQNSQNPAELEEFVMKPEDASALSAEEIAAKRADFYKGLLKQERAKKAQTKEEPISKKEDTQDLTLTAQAIEERVNLRMDGYTPEDIKDIEAFAKGAGIGIPAAKDHPFVKAAIDARRAQAKSEANTPSPSNSAPVYNGKTFKEVATDDKAPATDKQAAFEALMAQKAAQKR